MPTFIPGTPRIKLLNSDGSVNAIYYLPPPDKDGISEEWVEIINSTKTMIDGSEQTRRLGWIYELKLKWSVYNDFQKTTPYTAGLASGNILDFAGLKSVLDNPYGSLIISPGPSAGGFLLGKTTMSGIAPMGSQGIVTGLTLTLRGSYCYPTKLLGAF